MRNIDFCLYISLALVWIQFRERDLKCRSDVQWPSTSSGRLHSLGVLLSLLPCWKCVKVLTNRLFYPDINHVTMDYYARLDYYMSWNSLDLFLWNFGGKFIMYFCIETVVSTLAVREMSNFSRACEIHCGTLVESLVRVSCQVPLFSNREM